MVSKQQDIVSTLAYYDIFDFPLTLEEIRKYLPHKLSEKEIQEGLKNKRVLQVGHYFMLVGKEKNVRLRLERNKISESKLEKIKKLLYLLNYIPTVLYVGISGSLAMRNAKESDDIDLFIITKAKTLWFSRLLVNSILLLRGKLRLYGYHDARDTICTNMWIDTNHFLFSKERQNIYTAHEIVQLLHVINKKNTYNHFLGKNIWIREFFPNISIKIYRSNFSSSSNLGILEFVAKKLQLWYMSRHRTTEVIQEGFVAFHPNDYTKKVLRELEKRQKV